MAPDNAHDPSSPSTATATSPAHARSAFAIIDPAYASDAIVPEAPESVATDARWLSGDSDLECHRLQVLRQRAAAAQLPVHYPGAFREPATRVVFRCECKALPRELTLRASGSLRVVVWTARSVSRRTPAMKPSASPSRIVPPRVVPRQHRPATRGRKPRSAPSGTPPPAAR